MEMEILFMIFMVVVSTMAIFAVAVVLRDIVREIRNAKKSEEDEEAKVAAKCAEFNAAQNAPAAPQSCFCPPCAQTCMYATNGAHPYAYARPIEPVVAPVQPVVAPVVEPVAEPVEEVKAPVDVVVDAPEAADDDTISFAKGQQQTLDEKYLELPSEARGWYDAIIKHASAVEGSKRFKTARYEDYKVGKNRLVRMLIKRGVIQCEFILHNSDFKNYVNENKIAVKQGVTVMYIENEATVEAAKDSIDIVVAAIAEEKEFKKQQAKERRKAAKAAEAEAVTSPEEAAAKN